MARPVGVTILAVLAIIGGIALLCLGGLAAIGGSALAGSVAAAGGAAASVNSGVLVAIGGFTAVLGVLYIVMGVGLLQLKGWAWLLGVILSIIGLVGAVVEIATKASTIGNQAIGIIFSVIILVYLFTPRVRQAFGRG